MFHVRGMQGSALPGMLEQLRRHRLASGVVRLRRVAPSVAEADQPLATSEGGGRGDPLVLEAMQVDGQASVVAAAACSSSCAPKAVDAINVDVDTESERELQGRDLPVLVLFADREEPDFLEALPLLQIRWVITTSPQREFNRALLHRLQTAHHEDQGWARCMMAPMGARWPRRASRAPSSLTTTRSTLRRRAWRATSAPRR